MDYHKRHFDLCRKYVVMIYDILNEVCGLRFVRTELIFILLILVLVK